MLTHECSRQRLVLRFHDHTFSGPLPELFLGGPEFFTVAADDQRRLFLFFLFLFRHLLVLTKLFLSAHVRSPTVREGHLTPAHARPLTRLTATQHTSAPMRALCS